MKRTDSDLAWLVREDEKEYNVDDDSAQRYEVVGVFRCVENVDKRKNDDDEKCQRKNRTKQSRTNSPVSYLLP